MYVIRGHNGYVAKEGSSTSYVRNLEMARKFKTKEEAESNICPENERILDLHELMRRIMG